jgi:predicted Rossmann fold nucleotide-binding protein DprA/Smf involved in DNA uptake
VTVTTADAVLDNLAGQMTAQQLADRTGLTVRDTVLALCALEEEGRVVRKVDVEGSPVARWRAVEA